MSLLKRLADAIRINPGFHVSGMHGAIEIEDVANRSRQFVPIAAGVRVELQSIGDDGTKQVVLMTAGQSYTVSVPLRAGDADAWASAVSKEIRRAIGGRRGGLAWVALVLAFLLVLWFIAGVLGALGGMRAPVGPLGAAPPAPNPSAAGLPASMDLDAYWRRALADAEGDIAADHAARAAAGIGAEVCDAPETPAGTPPTNSPSMGEAPPIAGFTSEENAQ